MTYTEAWFKNPPDTSNNITVEITDEQTLKSQNKGDIKLRVLVHRKEEIIKIKNIYYISELDGNLLSYGTLEKRGLECCTKNKRMQFLDTDDDITLQTTHQAELTLYLLNLTINAQQKAQKLTRAMTTRI